MENDDIKINRVEMHFEDGTSRDVKRGEKLIAFPQDEFDVRFVDRQHIVQYARNYTHTIGEESEAIFQWIKAYFKITDEELQ